MIMSLNVERDMALNIDFDKYGELVIKFRGTDITREFTTEEQMEFESELLDCEESARMDEFDKDIA